MDESLKNLLDNIQLDKDLYNDFDDVQINKVEYIESKNLYVVYLELTYPIYLSTYIEFEKKLKESDLNFKANYNIQRVSDNNPTIYGFYYYFLKLIESEENVTFLRTIDAKYEDNELIVSILNEGLKLMFEPYKRRLEDMMKLAGFNINYTYIINSNDEVNREMDYLIEKNAKVNIVSPPVETIKQKSENKTNFKKSLTDLSKYSAIPIEDVYDDALDICIEGYIFDDELIKTKSGRHIQVLKITDYTDSIQLKRFESGYLKLEDLKKIGKGQWIKALGDVRYDTYSREHVMTLKAIETIKSKIVDKYDLNTEKRVELHLHTKMSRMDGVSTVEEFIDQALKYGHKAIAITDHTNVQSFPDAYNHPGSDQLKIIYGLEANLIDDEIKVVLGECQQSLAEATYVYFDLETTGLKYKTEEIIEIGAIKYKDGIEIDRFQSFVKPNKKVSLFIKELTGISDHDLIDAPTINNILPDFLSFIEGSVLVAHNATFDMGFLQHQTKKLGLPKLKNCVIDTLQLSRILLSDRKQHSLGRTAKAYKVYYDAKIAHRADYDAEVLSQIFEKMKKDLLENHQLTNINEINTLCNYDFLKKQRPFHCTLLAKNQKGLKDLFKLVSISHTELFENEPNLFRSTINEHRKNLLVGSGTIYGEVYEQALNVEKERLIEIIKGYDYVEVFPIDNLIHLIDLGDFKTEQELRNLTKYIIECAQEAEVMVIASSDCYYVNAEDKNTHEIYINAKGKGGKMHRLFDYKGRIKHYPTQYFRSTDEMLACFDFLDYQLAHEIVIDNPNKIADMIEEVKPIKDKLYTPTIPGVDKKLIDMCQENAHKMYGDPLPKIVEQRLDKELKSITEHGFSVVYYISSQLVEKSLEDGYLVGSRGSVGSSFVATMANITEVNPLQPHYYCPNCQYSEFDVPKEFKSGYDLPPKQCPKCQSAMKGDGQDIPFETFLGFKGDKVPDIDLNFSGEYQPRAHDYTKVLFGEDHVFRAGTISTVQKETAMGYVKGYFETIGDNRPIRRTELERLALDVTGTKTTTGQHPGGIIVIPKDMDVHDFTPVNYPADDLSQNWKTTHFDFHAIHDNVLKLDILGHVDPTAIRMLQDLTQIEPKSIPLNDEKVLSLFSSAKALGLDPKQYKNGALGIPEFGTNFVRGMLEDTNPQTFADLIQISGLSHGTDVWLGNAKTLIETGQCQLSEVIGCRDDIMVYLIDKGLDPQLAFTIMEKVRKGKAHTIEPETFDIMREHNVPEWYIDSCLKIKYMFPKAHAVAYVSMALRIAWFKIYYPLEYYSVFFTKRCKDTYDIVTMSKGIDEIQKQLDIIDAKEKAKDPTNRVSEKERNLVNVYDLSLELYNRGFSIQPVDLLRSDAINFIVDHENKTLIPPFKSIDGLGINVAYSIIEAREENPFISKEDLEKRTKINKTQLALLEAMGSLAHLQDSNQLSLF